MMSLFALEVLSLFACRPQTGDTGPEVLVLDDAHNYHYEATLQIESTPLEAEHDADLSWGGLTTDLRGFTVDPTEDVVEVLLVAFPYLEPSELEDRLVTNALKQADVGLYVSLEPGDRTEANLGELTLNGTDIGLTDYFQEDSGTWLLVLSGSSDASEYGVIMLALLEPLESSDAHELEVTDRSATLEAEADLTSPERVEVDAGAEAVLDWSAVTTDGLGQSLDASLVSRAEIYRYDSLDLADLEAEFLRIDGLADRTWEAPVSGGTSVSLDDFADSEGKPLDLEKGATWLFGLRCDSCLLPAPLLLTALEVR